MHNSGGAGDDGAPRQSSDRSGGFACQQHVREAMSQLPEPHRNICLI